MEGELLQLGMNSPNDSGSRWPASLTEFLLLDT
jgi:hypothetical protein